MTQFDYKILTHTDPARLQQQVQAEIENGFRPLGPCQTNAVASVQGIAVVFTQTLTRGGWFAYSGPNQ